MPITPQARDAASRKRTREKHERWATEMRAAGWTCLTPEASEGVMVPSEPPVAIRDLMRKIRAESVETSH